MSPLQIKLAIYALTAIIIVGAYFGWAYHQQQIGYEKAAKEVALRDAEFPNMVCLKLVRPFASGQP